jgi:hypothetical protein
MEFEQPLHAPKRNVTLSGKLFITTELKENIPDIAKTDAVLDSINDDFSTVKHKTKRSDTFCGHFLSTFFDFDNRKIGFFAVSVFLCLLFSYVMMFSTLLWSFSAGINKVEIKLSSLEKSLELVMINILSTAVENAK